MTAQLALMPNRRTIRRLDAAAAATAAVFVALGVLTGVEVVRLAQLSTSLLDGAEALDQVGRALDVIAQLPLVGSAVGPLAGDVQQTAASTRAGGVQAGAAVRQLAVVLGLAVALIPAPALLAGYLPLRRARAREIRGLRRLLADGRPVEETLIAHLAHGAVSRLPYARLRQVSPDPWADLAAGRHRPLAAAELRRLGVAPPAHWTGPPPSAPHPDRG